MSIVLTHSYFLYEDDKEQKIMKPYPPLGLLYVSGYLKKDGVLHHVYDTTFSSLNEQLIFIEKQQPKIVAIYTNLMTKIKVIELVEILKSEKIYGNPTIILGGPDVTYNLENYLQTGVDFIVIGEGEITFKDLSECILENKPYQEVPGIAYLKNGTLIKTVPRVKIKELSELARPNREEIDVKAYLDIWKKYHGENSITISTQRGCPYTCKWCSTAVYGQSYRRRPVEDVVAELKELKEKYNPDKFWFVDDVFTVSHKWIKAFQEELTKENVEIAFECITRAERLNDEILEVLKSIGCFRIWIGAESGSQKIIDAMDRRVNINLVKEMIQKTNVLGIETGTFIMIGYPGETYEDINKTTQYLIEANPTHYTITKAYPIKGTGLYDEVKDKIKFFPNWEKSTDRDLDFKRAYSTKFYDYSLRYIANKVSLSKTKYNFFINCKQQLKLTILKSLMLFYKWVS